MDFPESRWVRNLILMVITFLVNYTGAFAQSAIGPALAYAFNLADANVVSMATILKATAIGCGIAFVAIAVLMFARDMLKDSDLIGDFIDPPGHNSETDQRRRIRTALRNSRFASSLFKLTPQIIVPLCVIIGLLILQESMETIRAALAAAAIGVSFPLAIGGAVLSIARDAYNTNQKIKYEYSVGIRVPRTQSNSDHPPSVAPLGSTMPMASHLPVHEMNPNYGVTSQLQPVHVFRQPASARGFNPFFCHNNPYVQPMSGRSRIPLICDSNYYQNTDGCQPEAVNPLGAFINC